MDTIRVLYVDDEPDLLRVVQKGLAVHGFSVDIISRPEIVAAMDLSTYQMIILDIRMPHTDGFKLYELIKPQIDEYKIRVCFFSAFVTYQDEFAKKFPMWHGSCFITKPMSTPLLAGKLKELLKN
jgi:putative two-component system response regulator